MKNISCILKGDPFSRAFVVRAEDGHDISNIKHLVKNEREPELGGVDAEKLVAYNVSIPRGDLAALEHSYRQIEQGKPALQSLNSVKDIFPNPAAKHVHLIVQLLDDFNLAPPALTRTVAPSKTPTRCIECLIPAKRSLSQDSQEAGVEFSGYNDLFRKIGASHVSLDSCSNPEKILSLPFPFLGRLYPMERFPLQDGCFDYMGREMFAELVDKVNDFENPYGHHTLYLYATIGYGKSYILAALTCLLMKEGKRVVFLPDSRAMWNTDFGCYVTWALLLCFGDSPTQQQEIDDCQEIPDELIHFCRQQSKRKVLLYFIVDQYNELDEEDSDFVENALKARSKDWLLKITSGHCLLKSASADFEAAMYRERIPRNEIEIAIYGGFTVREMGWWWKHYTAHLPTITKDDEEEIADLTGRIPLLLRALLAPGCKSYQNTPAGQERRKVYQEERVRIFRSKEFLSVHDWVARFAKTKKRKLGKAEFIQYVELMDSCLRNAMVGPGSLDLSLLDHRYFFVRPRGDDPDDSVMVGFATCGLARTALARALRGLGEDIFLGWGPTISAGCSNKSILGFAVEQLFLSSISQWGLQVGSINFGPMKTVTFAGGCPDRDIEYPLTLYVPLSRNFPAIEGVVVSLNPEGKLVLLMPLLVAIGRRDIDSEQRFFRNWKPWGNWLKLKGYKLQVKFLWITEEGHSTIKGVLTNETTPARQKPEVEFDHQYERSYITVEDLNKGIWEQLKTGRRGNPGPAWMLPGL